MNATELISTITNLNWQAIIAIFMVNWFFYHKLDAKIEKLDERMFQLATGKSLADAIKEERMKRGG